MSAPKKIRRDAKLKGLPEEQRKLVVDWESQDGVDLCLARMRSELGIEVGKTALYEALTFWRSEARFSAFHHVAQSQAEVEAAARGGMSPEEMEAAVDRNFLGLATELQDTKLYLDVRSLRIRDAESKGKRLLEEAKLAQGAAKIAQAGQALQLAERRVGLLEANAREAKEKLTAVVEKARGGLTAETLKQIEEAAGLL